MENIRKYTPENITELKDKEVFVFGSNIQGEHVGGAAYAAFKNFGAKYGVGFGMQGESYAIPTCVRLYDEDSGRCYTKPLDNANQIKPFVDVFINETKCVYTDWTFYVTKIGCGIGGFSVGEIAELFRPCLDMDNVILPKEFVDYLTDKG